MSIGNMRPGDIGAEIYPYISTGWGGVVGVPPPFFSTRPHMMSIKTDKVILHFITTLIS